MVRLWVAMLVGLAVALGAREVSPRAGQEAGALPAGGEASASGDGHAAERRGTQEGARFEAIDIFVDSGVAALAAYQVEAKATAGDVRLVGVEGGEHAAFAPAPHYDPAVLHAGRMRERIVIAAFSTAGELPTGRTRVARLHVRVTGEQADYAVRLETAGGADGKRIQAKVDWAAAAGGAGDRK